MPAQGPSRESPASPAPLTDLSHRSIPPLVYLQLFTGGALNQFGLLWIAICLPITLILGSLADLKSIGFGRQQLATAQGTVEHVAATGSSENNRRIYAIDYRYSPAGRDGIVYGRSYSSGRFSVDQPVTIEYQVADPAASRIRGTRMAPFGPGLIVMVGGMLLIGVALLGVGFSRSLAAARLLVRGRLALAGLMDSEPTNTKINGRRVYAMTFGFISEGGGRHTITTRTHQPELVADERHERVLYDPADPRRAALVDALPGGPRLDELGRVRPGSLRTLLLPVAIVVLAAVVLFVFQVR